MDPTAAAAPILAELDGVDATIASWAREAAVAGLRAGDIRAGLDALAAERGALEAETRSGAGNRTTDDVGRADQRCAYARVAGRRD